MAESPAVAAERDVLLATKLHMPASRPGQVRRPRLTARLDEGAARGLVLVCAPAGYGKTVLLADWARRGEHPAAWLSLDAGDNDPARFWRHAVAALDRARPGIGDRVSPLLGPPAPASFQGLVTALINDLAGEEALLVLDDYHVIGSQQVHESLAFLLEHRSAGLQSFEPSVGQAASLLANVPAAIAIARAYLAVLHGDAEGTAASASRALPALGEGEWVLHSASLWILAIAEWVRGRLEDAERGFAASVAGWRAAGQRPLAAWACFDLGRVQRARGRLDAPLATYQQVVEITAPPGRAAMPSVGIGYVGMAEVAYQRGELDTALQHVTKGIELCRQLNWKTQPLVAGLVTLAWIRQANGDPGGAREAIAEAGRIAPNPSLANLFNPVPAQRARLLLAQGDIAAAARWAQEGGLRADEPMYQTEREHLVLARVLLAQDRPAEALALLDRLHVAAAAQDRAGSLIEIGALRALALAARGDADRAVDALAEALTLACPQGYVRVFADEGPPMAVLLARLIAAQRTDRAAARVPLGCLARLHRVLGAQDIVPEADRDGVTAVPGLVEQLTSRELEVLAMLAGGRSNQAIAGQLVVTLDTVKKHVSHVLGKLGAANRTEAVARARELSLIP